ncbi:MULTISPECIES: hypothetical protein [Catenuloplanes]|uniref:Uncharacterized protein n=1 Tax=Catenuloplanes niger TaxID=587534 RepID=A0AAE3ZJ15_9ACTN|nr:hypothetical protein [Catenuloplanes niger]MDR7320793.1 hypothetical protein [Catenuloplanes niger]
MERIIEQLADGPAMVLSRFGVSPESAEVWPWHEVDVRHHLDLKRYLHPELG